MPFVMSLLIRNFITTGDSFLRIFLSLRVRCLDFFQNLHFLPWDTAKYHFVSLQKPAELPNFPCTTICHHRIIKPTKLLLFKWYLKVLLKNNQLYKAIIRSRPSTYCNSYNSLLNHKSCQYNKSSMVVTRH